MQQHDLPLEEAIPALKKELAELREAPNQNELTDIDSDTAFLLGYETAIHDLTTITGPSTVEVGIVALTLGEDGKWRGEVIEGDHNAE